MTTLYQMTEQFKALQELDGVEPQAIADTLEGLQGDVEEKAQAIVAVRAGMDADITAIDAEIARLTDRKKRIQGSEKRLRDYLKTNMQAMEITSIKCPLFSITLAKGRDHAVIDDEDALPDQYVKVKTTVSPDKPAILAALKAGEDVPGARLTKTDDSIRIK